MTACPDSTVQLCLDSDAVLLRSIGGPEWDNLSVKLKSEIAGLLELRKTLGLYTNIRPCMVYESLQEKVSQILLLKYYR